MYMEWPILRMFPWLVRSIHQLLDFATQVLKKEGHTFEFRGPWFLNMNMILTSDPANVNYILSKNASNFHKGPEFREIFDVLGNSIFSVDSESWRTKRKLLLSIFSKPRFQHELEQSTHQTIAQGLLPVLDDSAERGVEIDLQDVFKRVSTDIMCRLVFGADVVPCCLSAGMPELLLSKAFDDIEEAVFYRFIVPEKIWKLQRWLEIGKEKNLKRGVEIVDGFLGKYISLNKPQRDGGNYRSNSFDLLTAYMEEEEQQQQQQSISARGLGDQHHHLRDTALSLVFAGRDTVSAALTWFFWLLTKNPSTEIKIRQEMEAAKVGRTAAAAGQQQRPYLYYGYSKQSLSKLTYLQAAIFETLRLYPSIPIQMKTAIQPDTLPSGHRVNQNKRLLLFFYTMGRMEEIWGDDCLEFKPERWISENGDGLIHFPTYKFIAFNTGPRSCLGKEITIVQMKMVVVAILSNYHLQLLTNQLVSPTNSVVLHMNHGWKVKINRISN